jgi:hypothetical protein
MSNTAPRVDPARQCHGKVRHLSRRAARRARRSTPAAPGRHITIYRCPWCSFLHLGTAWDDVGDAAVVDMLRRFEEAAARRELEELDEHVVAASARALNMSTDDARRLLAGDELEEDDDG